MNFEYLESIRLFELEYVLSEINQIRAKKPIILEIGAGAGWQSKKVSESGYDVESIDLKDSNYASNRVWPVTNYDGSKIPFPDGYFDIVFSSNVLEHIPHIAEFQYEIQRVLKPSGIAIHILPTSVWRIWTSIMHYFYLPKTAISYVFSKNTKNIKRNLEAEYQREQLKKYSKIQLFCRILISSRHGETGNSLTEMYHFSHRRWANLFIKTNWQIEKSIKNKLFYTGYCIFGSALSLSARQTISKYLGSTCHIFILKKIKLID